MDEYLKLNMENAEGSLLFEKEASLINITLLLMYFKQMFHDTAVHVVVVKMRYRKI